MNDFYLATALASPTLCSSDKERLAINPVMMDWLKARGMKFRYEFRTKKAALAKVETLKAALADFPDFGKLVIEQGEGGYL